MSRQSNREEVWQSLPTAKPFIDMGAVMTNQESVDKLKDTINQLNTRITSLERMNAILEKQIDLICEDTDRDASYFYRKAKGIIDNDNQQNAIGG